jgi:hypothetical protein
MTGTQLIKFEPIPLPAPANPTPAWPAWLNEKTHGTSLMLSEQRDPATGELAQVWTLPPDRMLTTNQRRDAEQHRDQLVIILEQTPANHDGCAKRTFGLISELVAGKPSSVSGAIAIEARIKTYIVAVSDIPWWAIDRRLLTGIVASAALGISLITIIAGHRNLPTFVRLPCVKLQRCGVE